MTHPIPAPRPASNFRRSARTALLAVLSVLALAFPTRAGDALYATGTGNAFGLSGLYRIDPTSGAATWLWSFPGIHIYAGGLAYDPQTDKLYATGALDSDTGTTRLFVIDRFTGAVTWFPGMSPTINLTSGGLAIHPVTGVLYAVGQNGFQSTALFTIDKLTGAESLVGQNGGQCCVVPFGFIMYGLGFASDGTLYANGLTLSNPAVNGAYSHLYTLDLASGLATDIGLHGVNVGRQLTYSGLAQGADGTMYSLGSTSASESGLYSVDLGTGAATLIGPTVLGFGVDGGLVFAPDGAPTTFCTAKPNSQGCVPAVAFSGSPSASAPVPFLVTASNVINQRPGILFYGQGPSSVPFQDGFLCVASPIVRTPLQFSAGSALPVVDCSGTYSFDFNAWIQGGNDPLLVAGQQVAVQYWSRDPDSPSTTGLTDAVGFHIAQ